MPRRRWQAVQDRIGRQRDQRDVKRAEREAEDAEADAADALDYADWAVDQAQLVVLDAIDARTWAGRARRRIALTISALAPPVRATG